MSAALEPPSETSPHEAGSLRRGDHIRAGRRGVPHHDGIYLGDGLVIHLTGVPGGGKADARVRIDTLAQFAAGRPVAVRSYAGNRDPEAIIARAMTKLGDGNYHLIFNNCQHFARWCATGTALSEQVNSVAATSGTVAVPLIIWGVGLNVVGSAGLVAGLSGPGIMSGLAACGAAIGGGAVAGMVVLSAVPGVAGVAIVNRALRNDNDLPEAERAARNAGRAGAGAGALAGSAASIAAVSVLGVPGLSAAGISSGLAAIGKVLGGGMAAGTIGVIAAPALAAAVIGYLAYRFVLWLRTAGPSGMTMRLPQE